MRISYLCSDLCSAVLLGYSLCLQWGYHAADLSVVYPMARGTGPLLSSLAAFIWLGEQPSTFGVLGIFSIVAGILLIASDGNLRRFTAPQSWTGIRWGLFIGMFIAAYTVTDAYSVKVLLIAPVILDWLSALGNAVILDRKSVVEGKSVSVRVDLGEGRTFKKKKQ